MMRFIVKNKNPVFFQMATMDLWWLVKQRPSNGAGEQWEIKVREWDSECLRLRDLGCWERKESIYTPQTLAQNDTVFFFYYYYFLNL